VLSVLLALSVMAGCGTKTKPILVKLECPEIVFPTLPEIDAGELFDAVGSDVYFKLEDRESKITTWALQMEVLLLHLCE